VEADGKVHLVYELHLTNFSSSELKLSRVEVLSGNSTQLAQYEASELNTRLARPGLAPSNQERLSLGGGMRAVVYIWLTLKAPTAVPAVLRHRVTATSGGTPAAGTDAAAKKEPVEVKGEGAEIKVRSDAPLVISPPLRGGEWLAANGPGNASGHRRALVPIDGKARIAQRFAID